jgi:uncharacterized integral membrane protein (TIGR00698 family)
VTRPATLAVAPVAPNLTAALPGLVLPAGLAAAAMALHVLPGLKILSPAILAVLLGIALRQLFGLPAALRPGLTVAARTLLRVAVVLLGLQVTVGQVVGLGLGVLLAVAGGLAANFLFTVWLGARMGVGRRLTRLIAVGTSVCGASAIVAANSVTGGDDEDVAYSLAAVTLFGTVAMLAMPLAAELVHAEPHVAGLWLGASIHEVAQVVGAASQLGDAAMQTATIAKMARVLMLAPLVLALAAVEHRRSRRVERARLQMPWFVFGFIGLTVLASLKTMPGWLTADAGLITSFLLAAALAALGYGMDVSAILRRGWRPLLLALLSWLAISAVSLLLLYVLA